jgi:DNA polymerase
MLVGEGPGKTENDTGVPFSGPAGQLMTKIFALAGIQRQSVYWTNTVRCHPPNNRVPSVGEMDACRPLLLGEIEHIQPKVIILAGSTAIKNLLKIKSPMGEVAGRWARIKGIPTVCIYHPAAVLHTQERDPETCLMYKKSIWKAIQEVRAHLGKDKPEIPNDLGVNSFAQDGLFK